MKIITENKSDYKAIRLVGRLDTQAVAGKEKEILEVFNDQSQKFVIDCADIDYISSSGLRVFLKIQKKLSARQAKLVLHSMSEKIYDIFKICNFTTLFTIAENREAAEKLL